MLETVKINTTDLEVGMFVSSLDRPWLDSSFLIQGFRIETREQIDRLRSECEYVLIDTRQSRQRADTLARKVRNGDKADPAPKVNRVERPRISMERIFDGHTISAYEDNSEFIDEHPLAQHALEEMLGDVC